MSSSHDNNVSYQGIGATECTEDGGGKPEIVDTEELGDNTTERAELKDIAVFLSPEECVGTEGTQPAVTVEISDCKDLVPYSPNFLMIKKRVWI